MKVLISAFEPFGGSPQNVSWNAVSALTDFPSDIEIRKICLPVVFGKAWEKLKKEIDAFSPDAVICTGQAKESPYIRVERVALNIDDARIPDNQGNMPDGSPVIEGAQNAWFSNLPVKKIVASLARQGIPAKLSHSAGTYVCNHLFFQLMNHIYTRQTDLLGGFIHVPADEEDSTFLTGMDFSGGRVTEALKIVIFVVYHHLNPISV